MHESAATLVRTSAAFPEETPRRILLVAASFPPRVGGYEVQTAQVASTLASAGHRVVVLTCAPAARLHSMRSGTPYAVEELPARFLLGDTYPVPNLRAFREVFRTSEWDLVITNTRFFAPSLLAAIECRSRRIPLIHVEHGSSYPRGMRKHVTLLGRLYDMTAGRFVMRTASLVVAVSASACEFSKRIGARRVETIPNGVAFPSKEEVAARILRAAARSPESLPRLVFVGRLVRNKGVHLLLAATRHLQDRGVRADVVIVGDGPERGALEAEARRLGLKEVRFTGALTGSQLKEEVVMADIFVSPSYSEGFGLAVLEAASFGVPIVASRCEGHLNLLSHGETALLHRVDDHLSLATELEAALRNPEAAAKRATHAYEKLSVLYALGSVATRWHEILRSLTGEAAK